MVAHGAILRVRCRDPLIADQVAINPQKAPLTDKERAMVAFAMKVAVDSANLDAEDFERLRSQGFSESDIWDIGAIASLFAYSNRMANFASIMPNPEFSTMGR